jgi:hypothetical protein
LARSGASGTIWLVMAPQPMEADVDRDALERLLRARLQAAGLPVPEDQAALLSELEVHLARREVLRAATADLRPEDPPAGTQP